MPTRSKILKLRAFREYPRQKYSTPFLPLTVPQLVAAYPTPGCMALQGLQLFPMPQPALCFSQEFWRSRMLGGGLIGRRMYEEIAALFALGGERRH